MRVAVLLEIYELEMSIKSGEELEKEPESDICEEDNDEVSVTLMIKCTLFIYNKQ